MNLDTAELRERIRERLSLADVMEHDGMQLRRAGPTKHTCACPFHVEKHASFVVGGKVKDRGHCFGCSWDGDIFAYWIERRSVDFKQALQDLAGLAGIPCDGVVYQRPARGTAPVRPAERLELSDSVKPSLPPLRQLKRAECEQLAHVRGLHVDAVRCAAYKYKRLAFSMWPLHQNRFDGEWVPRSGHVPQPSWVATDPTLKVAEYRRLDGEKYPVRDGEFIKSWSTAGKNWPLGAGQIGNRLEVLMVEGAPDMIAAYHFLIRWGMEERVSVVCMLGASNSIRPEARAAFKGKKVRIMMDADAPKDDENPRKRKMPGAEAVARWTGELTEAGAAVEDFTVGPIFDAAGVAAWGRGKISAAEIEIMHPGLVMPDGTPVKDLNNLAVCPPEMTDAPEIRDAFCAWDFSS